MIKMLQMAILYFKSGIMFDDIALFVHIVQYRGLSAAAEQLQLPSATVTRRLQKLERALHCRLIHRSARQFNLTAEGEVYYQAYAGLVHQLENTQRLLSSDMQQLSGSLKVLAPTNISTGLLQPMWSAFIKKYPDIQLQLLLNNNIEDIHKTQADITLRIGPQEDSQLYQKRLGSIATVLVASPDYLHQAGVPETLDDLHQKRLVCVHSLPAWALANTETNQRVTFRPVAATSVNDVRLASQLVVDSLGIALLPVSEVSEALRTGSLLQVLPEWHGPLRYIYAVWPSGRLLNAKAKTLREFMQQFIAEDKVLQGALWPGN